MHIQKPLEKCAQNLWAKKFSSHFVGLIGVITTLAISPYVGDFYNFPKLIALIFFAALSFLVIFTLRDKLIEFRVLLAIIGFFVASLFLVLFFSGAPISIQIWGTEGRNTGLLAYLSLAVILIVSALFSTREVLLKTFKFLIVAGSFSTVYALLQRFNSDPLPTFTIYRPVTSFFGNPNFQAAFSALTLIAAVGIFLEKNSSKALRVFLIFYVEATIFVVLETQSLQGIIVSILGALILLGVWIFKDPNFSRYKFGYSILFPSILLSSLFGMLNHGPLAKFLYKESVAARGDFWRAGGDMFKEKPIFGVGLDNYGAHYAQKRDEKALARDPQGSADAAHNVFIDFAANGGIILFLSYSLIVLFTLYCAFRALRNSTQFDPLLATLFAVWIGYQAQSIISINQLGVAVWGWIFSGLLIGYSKN